MDKNEPSDDFGRSANPVSAQRALDLARQYIKAKDVESFRGIIKNIPQDNLSALLAVAFKRVEVAQQRTHDYYRGLVYGEVRRDLNTEQSLRAKRASAFVKFKTFADILMDAGAQIGWKNAKGENFLHRCARWNAYDAIRWAVLEKKFTEINEPATDGVYLGYTPLHIACNEKGIEAALELVWLNADIKILTPDGKEAGQLLKGDHLQDEFYRACRDKIAAESEGLNWPEPVPHNS